ncbi:cysteine-1-D-myo-inosityl 2-amino-2-deoxy-alpha-D-glucopyranoside ligase [Propionibacterium sp. oral taxon 192 str. F0372]|uniref:cysteine--1-D-myo-inosityl 2-amino-2-deoxy-alpha-D-glucopyranoside ligase n=1 Tax=Propionibacterium sp. oral taxon 192 TaxID=671222 RepID=UPI0003528CEC|nr:cysteine--1-D-myo-inosityl 2-amino-2-deoxy-alpha-D-glucopyranoside ligase [Propionibacterium sp. oral taxon 192]EPH00226.1 cysteine-1-D-myo-inosityl 2-amino-2-deoxy-alpha-D-glucopyranoside ligase [Propionibacterium sp. oral taxon 192 str. F0372]
MRAWTPVAVPALPPSRDVPDQVQVWDTKTQTLRRVGPRSGEATLYVCGITPYDATHLGHAFTYLTFDLLQRVWIDTGLTVRYAQNITDIDDPLLERADGTGVDWRELAASQIDLFREDMTALRVLPPQHYVAATDAMELVESVLVRLQKSGLLYRVEDPGFRDWYFRTAHDAYFGAVSHLDYAEQLAQFAAKGGDPDREGKKERLDALMWRLERPGEPSWASRFGQGRPGWHVECTAIAQHYLAGTVSVQGGGADLAFPHHEMCASIGRAANDGNPFAEAYVHVGMVGLEGQKMSKSLGNLELVSRLRAKGVAAPVIRLALLAHHYRHDWEWFATDIGTAQRRADAWEAAFRASRGTQAAPMIAGLRRAMRTDLDSPKALTIVDEWVSAVLAGDGDDVSAPAQVAAAVDALLGISFD